MKKILPIFIALLFIPSIIFAQNGWEKIHTFDYGTSSIFFLDSLDGFATSASSGIYKTTDGGKTWAIQYIPNLDTNIFKIISLGQNILIGIGSNGTLIKSINGGDNWKSYNIGSSNDLLQIYHTKDNKLFVIGYGSEENRIYKSTDFGETWKVYSLDTLTISKFINDISFINSNVGYGVGFNGSSLKTIDGGDTWFNILPILNASMTRIKFLDENIGYVLGGADIAKTTDGGKTWAIKYHAGYTPLHDISLFNNNIVWVVGDDKILKSTDAGESWFIQSYRIDDKNINSIDCIDSNICFASGLSGMGQLGSVSIYKTTNGGVSAPTLSYPEDKAIELPLILSISWTSLPNNNPFRVLISKDSSFDKIKLDTVVSTTSINITALDLNTTYYWKVQEKFGNEYSPFSKIWSFTTTKGAPILSSPLNNSIDLNLAPVLSWNDPTLAANSYQIQVSTNSEFNNPFFNSTTSNKYIEIQDLHDSTLYYWRVRANINNEYGAWSEVWKFTTLAKTARLLKPLNNSVNSPINNITFEWSKTAGTMGFTLQISGDSTFNTNVIEKKNLTVFSTNVTENLNYNTKYFWRVGAQNFDGKTYWSEGFNFYTKQAPTASFPLSLGNKWYYQAGSDHRGYYYGVKKEITDTLADGFRVLTDTYYYKDSIATGKEYWGYIDGKFYVDHQTNDYVYDDYLTKDSCSSDYSGDCRYLVKYEIFDSTYSAQQRYVHVGYMSGATLDKTTIVPDIGIVKNYHYVYVMATGSRTDSSYLVGMFRNGEVLGDTTFQIPFDTVTASFPLNLGQTWVYHVYYNNRGNNEKVIRKVTKVLDNGYREITLTYLLTAGIQIKKEYWLYKDGKFYYSDLPDMSSPIICYDVTLKAEECTFNNGQICVGWSSNKYSFNGKEYEMQFYQNYSGGNNYIINVANNIGPVLFLHSDTTEELISMSFDTTTPIFISSPELPLNNSTEIKRDLELKWKRVKDAASYDIQISKDSTFSTVNKEYTGLTDTSISIDSLDYSTQYYWRVKTVGSLGYEYWSNIWKFTTINLPTKFELYQNYPNPFNPVTKIKYDLPKAEHVTLKIYDALGREVALLINEEKPAGSYEVEFNGKNLSSGIYFYKIQAGSYSSVKKMILMK